LERAQWDYDRAKLLLKKAKTDLHEALKRESDAYGALLVAKHKASGRSDRMGEILWSDDNPTGAVK
jgi:hypothetical protein